MSSTERSDPERLNDDATEATRLLPGTPPSSGVLGVRHLIAFLGFLGFANVYAMRVNLSVAIVAMVNNSAIPHVNGTDVDVCPAPPSNGTDDGQKDGEFAWDESLQGLVLGSFFWGYLVTNFPGGRIAELVGGKLVMGVGVFGTAVLTILSPVFARWDVNAFIVLRILEGMFEGVTFPSMTVMLARWVPPMERSQTVAIVFAGAIFGTVVSMPLSGVLCNSDFLGGWPSVFYLFGAAGIVWSVAWMLLASDTPANHRFISDAEKNFITSALRSNNSQNKALPIPWKSVLSSPPFWGICVTHITQNWGFYTLLTELPTYMKNILNFDLKQNGILSALPYFIMWITSLVTGFTVDRLRFNGTVSTTFVRKFSNSMGSYVPAVCLILAGFTGCDATLSVIVLTLAVGINGFTYSGYNSSHLDIAPNFAGSLMGMTNTLATIPGFLAPVVTGALINGQQTLGQWRIVFGLAAIMMSLGNTVYVLLFVGEPQPWNEPLQPAPELSTEEDTASNSQVAVSPSDDTTVDDLTATNE